MSLPEELIKPVEAAQRRTTIVLRIVRAVFVALMTTFALLAALQQQQSEKRLFIGDNRGWMPVIVAVGVSLILVVGAIAIDLATPKKKISAITGVIFGVLAGVLATAALGFIIDLLLESWMQNKDALDVVRPVANSLKVLIGITLSYIGTVTIIQTQDDFRLVIPYVEFAKQIRGVRPLLLDSSSLIDGRITDVAATGFLQGPVIIPRFVVQELQTLADSADSLKRARGRRGLDMVTRVQRLPRVDVSIEETMVPGTGADQMLVELARMMPAVVVTADVALMQVARINGVTYLNLNDLANSLKSALVPGEAVTLTLLRAGAQAGQAVGYLPDGAMVVCENGSDRIGQNVNMVVQSSLQTSAGRLIFARIPNPLAATPAATATSPLDSQAGVTGGPDALAPTPFAVASAPALATAPGSVTDAAGASTLPNAATLLAETANELPPATPPASAPPTPNAAPKLDGPFPPNKVNRPTRPGTPRNPRR